MNNNVIGGEYVINPILDDSKLHNERKNYYSCGRMAIKAILMRVVQKSNEIVLLPDHFCESIPYTISQMGIGCSFYRILDNFQPDISSIESNIKESKAIVLVNYFGLISNSFFDGLINRIKSINNDIIVIMDNVQNYFGMDDDLNFDYSFTSFRKWFPVPDGSTIIYRKGNDAVRLFPENDKCGESLFAKYKFAGNVLKMFNYIIGDEICLELIEKGEKLLSDSIPISSIDWTGKAMEIMDYQSIKEKRRYNAKILHEGLVKLGIKHLYIDNAIPLFVPIVLEDERDRNRIRKRMFENKIFCPIHWDETWKQRYDNVHENNLSKQELSLICDQRYGEEEMSFQLEILENEC
ncbi:hypothetical protein SAMN02910369_01316 [Lachnospiraceae bacterium NE2001]|nr:hypothetical protein SAMN02910369_01316 [Lachnospiraceae bacterium NE2001]